MDLLRKKYLSNHSLQSWPTERRASHIWRSIVRTKEILQKGLKWIVGNGEDISLFNDWWCGDSSIANKYPNLQTDPRKVNSILVNGEWNISSIINEITFEDIENIHKTPIPAHVELKDIASWTANPNGEHTMKAAYELLTNHRNSLEDWRWIWKLKIPQKLKRFHLDLFAWENPYQSA